MKRSLSFYYIIFAFAFLFFTLLFVVFSTVSAREKNTLLAENHFSLSTRRIASAYLVDGRFNSSYVVNQIRESVSSNPAVVSVVITTKDHGTEYLFSRNNNVFTSYPPAPETLSEVFQNSLTQKTLKTTLPVNISGVMLYVKYTVLGPSDTRTILIRLLFALIIFLTITCVVLILSSNKNSTNSVSQEKFYPSEQSETHSDSFTAAFETDNDAILAPQEGLHERLKAELDRAASFDQDITLMIVTFYSFPADSGFSSILQLIPRHFKFSDLCFEYNDNGFAVILLNEDLDSGISRAEGFRRSVREIVKKQFGAAIGLSSRNGRLLDAERLLKETYIAVKKSKSAGDNSVIGFRPDPVKYRSMVASKI